MRFYFHDTLSPFHTLWVYTSEKPQSTVKIRTAVLGLMEATITDGHHGFYPHHRALLHLSLVFLQLWQNALDALALPITISCEERSNAIDSSSHCYQYPRVVLPQ